MASGDLEAVREVYAAFNRGDYERSTALLHEDVELHQWAVVPDADTYAGRDEFVRGISRWLSGFERGFQFVLEDATDAGDRVLCRVVLSGRGRGSGIELEQRVFQVWEVREGQAYRCWVFSTEREAWEQARRTV